MAISIQQLESSKARAQELKAEAKHLDDLLTNAISEAWDARKADKEARGCSFHDAEAGDELEKLINDLSAELKTARDSQRLEEVVFEGLTEAYLDQIELELLASMALDAEKFDGQKVHFKKPKRMIDGYAEAIGVRIWVSEYNGFVEIAEPVSRKDRSLYVCPGSWEGSSYIHRFDAETIRNLHELALAKAEKSLTAQEIRAQARVMLAEIDALEAEKKALAGRIDDAKDKYRAVFGYEIRELEDL